MSHGSRSSKQDSPIPFTMAPRALAETVRTWRTEEEEQLQYQLHTHRAHITVALYIITKHTSGTGSNREAFSPGMTLGR